jgi:hypothetical protein
MRDIILAILLFRIPHLAPSVTAVSFSHFRSTTHGLHSKEDEFGSKFLQGVGGWVGMALETEMTFIIDHVFVGDDEHL